MNRLIPFILLAFFFILSCGEPENNPKKKSVQPPPPKKEIKAKSTPVKNDQTDAPSLGATPEQLKKADAIIAAVSSADIEAVDAKRKYKMFCTVCHGFTGDMNVNGAKDLTASKISLREGVAQIYHGKGLMTPFNGILEDAEIVAVAKYIEGLRK